MIILVCALLTLFATILILNLTTGDKKIEDRVGKLYGVTSEDFKRAMGHLLGPALLEGNKIDFLRNGDEIFPAMLAAIHEAKESICFETFIYWAGDIGEQFSKALASKARAGIPVHVLLDAAGAGKIDKKFLEEMEHAGVEIGKYHPIRWYTLSRLNNRTHRKILVVDGKIGFTGGVGIADQWKGNAQDSNHWRDSHFKLEGPSVADMQSAFVDNWTRTMAAALHGPKYFPPLPSAGNSTTQFFRSSANEGIESMRLMYLLSIESSEKTLFIANAYFVPDDLTIETLVAAKRRGVNIEIILPGKLIDAPMVRRASRARWGKLLTAGIRIYEYQPTMYHCKVAIVDSVWTSVGSTNFDNRSFRLNDEANLNILNEAVAKHQEEVFLEDKKLSKEITLVEWQRRPIFEKCLDGFAALFRSQL